jgi:hypothetical protein
MRLQKNMLPVIWIEIFQLKQRVPCCNLTYLSDERMVLKRHFQIFEEPIHGAVFNGLQYEGKTWHLSHIIKCTHSQWNKQTSTDEFHT